jgi:hypothetical protein
MCLQVLLILLVITSVVKGERFISLPTKGNPITSSVSLGVGSAGIQKLGESLLFGGGLFVGFRFARLIERVLFNRFGLTRAGDEEAVKNATNDTSVTADLKVEQDELWRVTHQIYTEFNEKISTLVSAKEEAQLQMTTLTEKLSIVDGRLEDSIGSLKAEVDDKTDKISEIVYQLKADLPISLEEHDQKVIAKVLKYVQEIKAAISSRKKVP